MTDSNPSTRWGRTIIASLAAAGIDLVCIAPGSRSTPLAVAAAANHQVDVISLLDERSAGYFAVGRAKATGVPVAVITTSGTATANLHPAVLEADSSHTPLVVCTADRPPELQHSGANQTVTQTDLYGDAVRWAPTIPEAGSGERRHQALQTTVSRAVARSQAPVPGPVHLNIPFSKPLAPETELDTTTLADEAIVRVHSGRSYPSPTAVDSIAEAIRSADRGVIVAGPSDSRTSLEPLSTLAAQTRFPLLADALSGVRFGTANLPVRPIAGYDAYLDELPAADLVIRAGRRPTSRSLQEYLGRTRGKHIFLSPTGELEDPEYSTTDIIAADPGAVVDAVTEQLETRNHSEQWHKRFQTAETVYWNATMGNRPAEATVVGDAIAEAPSDATVFVSNSMPVRDLDRFGRARPEPLQVLANRGASGIDGIISSGLGAGYDAEEVIVITGDLALYHDMNGLLAIDRAGVDATIVVINNDGGGIFHKLPIASVDPPFTDLFVTPHGLNFEDTASLYDINYHRTDATEFLDVYRSVIGTGSDLIEVSVDGETNHHDREQLALDIKETIRETQSTE